jgi:hypothetical protein
MRLARRPGVQSRFLPSRLQRLTQGLMVASPPLWRRAYR